MNQLEQKTYVFLNVLGYLGGSQLYTLRKLRWLRGLGWRVVVIGVRAVDIRIPDFKEFARNDYAFLDIPSYLFSKKVREKYCCQIIRECGLCGHVVFQSHSRNFATWAELLAEKTKGIHLCHLLEETFGKQPELILALMRFKLSQNALWGIYERSIPSLLGKSDQTRNRMLVAAGMPEGAVADFSSNAIPEVAADFKILILGRSGKGYVRSALRAVVAFAENHPGKRIAVYTVGTSKKKAVVRGFDKLASQSPNVNAFWIDPMFPMPRRVFEIVDVCLSATGCAQIACSQRCLCISIDADDNQAIGVVGITTKNTLFRVDEPPVPVEDLLEEVLVLRRYQREDIQVPDFGLDYAVHAKLLDIPVPPSYFDFASHKRNVTERLRSLMLCFFGVRGCLALSKWTRRARSFKVRWA